MARVLFFLLEFIVALVIVRWLARFLSRLVGGSRANSGAAEGSSAPRAKTVPAGATVRDPVCGMFVSTELAQSLRHDGRTIHFCSTECLERYRKSNA